MLEYKREKINLEARLQELERKSIDHDDHIRIVDAWWLQVRMRTHLMAPHHHLPPSSFFFFLPPVLLLSPPSLPPFSTHLLTAHKLLQEIELLVEGTLSSASISQGVYMNCTFTLHVVLASNNPSPTDQNFLILVLYPSRTAKISKGTFPTRANPLTAKSIRSLSA